MTFAALLVPGVRQMDELDAAPVSGGIVLRPIEDTFGLANELRLVASAHAGQVS